MFADPRTGLLLPASYRQGRPQATAPERQCSSCEAVTYK